MATTRKHEWVRPAARPITTVGSRADVPDAPVTNGGSISTPN